MTSSVAVLVPWRAPNGAHHRIANWQWVERMWRENFPDYQLVPCDDGEQPFARAASINQAAANTSADVLIIADADVVVQPHLVREAVRMAATAPGMVQPFDRYVPLTLDQTREFRKHRTARRTWFGFDMSWWHCVSGCFAISRTSWDIVGGFDDRFRGWGYEDTAFDLKAGALTAPRRQVRGAALHLAHPEDGNRPMLNRTLCDEYMHKYGVRLIPRILHRVVPRRTSKSVEAYWERWQQLHPDWECWTWRDPLDSYDEKWETRHLWKDCVAGAQLAGFIRLEVLWRYGGVYVDSDLEPVQALDSLCYVSAFAGREDERVIPDFVLGAKPQHPAIRECLDRVLDMDPAVMFDPVTGPWFSGPGVTTAVLPNRDDVFIHPPVRFAPYHYSVKKREEGKDWTKNAETYAIHRWAHSWA